VKWITNAADSGSAEIYVYDEIGFWGTSADAFRRELQAIGNKPLTVRIHSVGGNLFDAIAMATLLAERDNVTTRLDGLAASAATVIHQAGRKRQMAESGGFMLHNPSVAISGDARELQRGIGALSVATESLLNTYTKRTGNSREQVQAWMDAETWMSSTMAKEHNFTDEVTPAVTLTASVDLSAFRNVPESIAATYRGRNQPNSETNNMATLFEILDRVTGKPTERETFLVTAIEALGLKADELVATKDPQAMKKAWDTAVAGATREADEKLATAVADHSGRILSVEAALKAAGFEVKVENIATLGDVINARIKEQASREALSITASRGIKPQPTAAAAAEGAAPLTLTEKAIQWRRDRNLPV
jgi:ATP-dependent protease ClpP protease subunit